MELAIWLSMFLLGDPMGGMGGQGGFRGNIDPEELFRSLPPLLARLYSWQHMFFFSGQYLEIGQAEILLQGASILAR